MQARGPIEHVIWDWNGTLLDDASLCLSLVNELLRECSLPPLSRDRYRDVFGFPIRDYYREIGFDLVAPTFEELSERFMNRYDARVQGCRLRPQARETLERLSREGLGQSVLSALKHRRLKDAVGRFGIGDLLTETVGIEDDLGDGKLAQGRALLERMEADAEQILFVGDTLHDLEVASHLKVQCVLIDGGHQTPERLEAAGGRVYPSLAEALAAHLG